LHRSIGTDRPSSHALPTFDRRRSSTDLVAKQKNSASSSASEQPKTLPQNAITLLSAASLVALDIGFRKLLKALSISFPSSLAGCATLFVTLILLNFINSDLGDNVYNLLSPGASVVTKWLPVFFVPSLVTLPLAQSFGSTTELLKVAGVVITGFYFTLFSTSLSVLGVRSLQNNKITTSSDNNNDDQTTVDIKATPRKAFSDSTFTNLRNSAIVAGITSVIASTANISILLRTPLQSLFMLFTTLSTFVFGARLPKGFTKVIHPLVTCTTLTWAFASMMGRLLGLGFHSMLKSYRVGSSCPVHIGAGDALLFMLGPAVIALACQMYDKKKLIKENIVPICTGVGVSSVGGLFGTALMVRVFQIGNPVLRLCMLSRNITSPLAMAIASIIGADISLAVSTVVVTGLIGANFGARILDWAGIKDPVARGLGIGAAAHGLGTAAFKDEKNAFPFAAISMALTASACTILISIPAIKSLVLKIAIGI